MLRPCGNDQNVGGANAIQWGNADLVEVWPQLAEEMRIRSSGASILFVGLGCPRQEVWAYEFRDVLPMPILAVGAAFAFLAGEVPQAPKWMQDWGLEWLFRLSAEPQRLWRRYVFLNSAYVLLVGLQATSLTFFTTDGTPPSSELLYG